MEQQGTKKMRNTRSKDPSKNELEEGNSAKREVDQDVKTYTTQSSASTTLSSSTAESSPEVHPADTIVASGHHNHSMPETLFEKIKVGYVQTPGSLQVSSILPSTATAEIDAHQKPTNSDSLSEEWMMTNFRN
uniref:Actin, muscle n=1 Tax=Lygus hesperus TaxID=30085 RepID=A0A0A9X0X7_LYGHE